MSYGDFTGATGNSEAGLAFGPPAPALPIVNTVSLKRNVSTLNTVGSVASSNYVINNTPTPVNNAGATFTIPVLSQVTQGESLFTNETFLGKSPFMGGSAMEVDWNGKVLWEIRRPDHHHDGRLLKNGNVMLLCAAELPDAIAARVKGGRAGTEVGGRKMWADFLVEMTTSGSVVWEWRAWEHLDPDTDRITALQDGREEWTHGNAIHEEPDGNLLVSFRDISTVIRIERGTGRILWKLGAPPLSGQHAPNRLANGNILMFDNGPHRLDDTFPFSRAIEVNPATNEIVWKYQEARMWNFFSPRISNAERLPNGNTLINEGMFGRFFEVTPQGDVVWEYVNPYFGPAAASPRTQFNSVFRVYRYSDEEIARARSRA